jgi:hypothetical protein
MIYPKTGFHFSQIMLKQDKKQNRRESSSRRLTSAMAA